MSCHVDISHISWNKLVGLKQCIVFFNQITDVKGLFFSLIAVIAIKFLKTSNQRRLTCQRSPSILMQVESNMFLWHYTVPLYHFHLSSATFHFFSFPTSVTVSSVAPKLSFLPAYNHSTSRWPCMYLDIAENSWKYFENKNFFFKY